jgi:hypothetical protein
VSRDRKRLSAFLLTTVITVFKAFRFGSYHKLLSFVHFGRAFALAFHFANGF